MLSDFRFLFRGSADCNLFRWSGKTSRINLPEGRLLWRGFCFRKALLVHRTSSERSSSRTALLRSIVEAAVASTPQESYVDKFLEKYPDYRKALWLAARSEDEGSSNPSYQGWQWSDLEMHPTRVLRLVIEGIARINLRTRRATYYLLKDPELVKRILKSSILK